MDSELTQHHHHQELTTATTTRKAHRNRNISFKVLDRRKIVNKHRQQTETTSPINMASAAVVTQPPKITSDDNTMTTQYHQTNIGSGYPSLKRLSSNSLPNIFEDIVDNKSSSYNNIPSPSHHKRSGVPSSPASSTTTLTSPLEFAGRYKIVVVGENRCGKTCLLNTFARRSLNIDTPLTYDDGVSTIRYGMKQVEFVIWDLSGCSGYDGFRVEMYRDTDLFIVCFDIGNVNSLHAVTETWLPEIQFEEPNASFILVGCKQDLRKEHSLPTSQESKDITELNYRQIVPKSKAEQIGKDWGAKDYIECCAKTGHNVSEVFKSAAQIFLTQPEEKTFKGLSMFRRRKSSSDVVSEIFYSSHQSTISSYNNNNNRFYPSYPSHLKRDFDGSF